MYHTYGHVLTMTTWTIHKCCLSLSTNQAFKTAIMAIWRREKLATSRRTQTERHLLEDEICCDALLEGKSTPCTYLCIV